MNERSKLARAVRLHAEGLKSLNVTVVPAAPAGRPASGLPGASGKAQRLIALAEEAKSCRRCPLYREATQAVISDGSADAELMFIGEAPGRDEDLKGVPFVGAAGQLLTKMIEAMGLRREAVYICNVVKHRPPANRTPMPDEMEACFPFLREQIAVVRPKIICTLGAVATRALLGPHVSVTRVRGELRDYEGTPLIATFHPAYLLRNPPAKKFAWEDLKKVKKLLEGNDG